MAILPISAQFEIEEGCTHRCFYCYNGFFPNIRKSKPTNDLVSREVAESGLFFVTLTGGEPLLSKKQIYRTMDILNKEQVDFSLNSNLYLLKKEDAKILKDKKVNGILTSILGSEEKIHDKIVGKKGAFKRLMNSLEYLCKENIWVSANMVVLNENIKDIYETGKMLNKNFGINVFCATPVVPSSEHTKKHMLMKKQYIHTLDVLSRLSDEYGMVTEPVHPTIPCIFDDSEREKYERFFQSRSCAAGKGTLGISIDGDIRVCSHDKNIYGNILNEPLDSIIQKMEDWLNGSFIPNECNPCSYVSKCRGGCRTISKIVNGSLDSLHPYFDGPVKEKPKKYFNNINLKNLKVTNKNIRYRENNDESYTIYADLRSNITTDRLGFSIFRRYMAGKTFEDLQEEIGNPIELRNRTKNFVNRGLLIKK